MITGGVIQKLTLKDLLLLKQFLLRRSRNWCEAGVNTHSVLRARRGDVVVRCSTIPYLARVKVSDATI